MTKNNNFNNIENDSTNSGNKKRFELKTNFLNGHACIIDWVESEQRDAICVFNDLGVLPFTSAPALCALLNELHDKCEFLEIENEALEDGATKYAELCHKSLKENEQLKERLKMNCPEFVWRDLE